MNEQENAILVVIEELGEVALELLELQKQLSKAMRFGIDEQRDLPTTNRERIKAEWNDLLGAICHLQRRGIDLKISIEDISRKCGKIEKYEQYSMELGTVKKENTNPQLEEIGESIRKASNLYAKITR